ncbi:muskelin-like [Apostichopus japonicus]|uniref:muskelin-like n=1 Tax=Stichopus japonicus TaxID=307972 RepID=UPI003AB34171
MAEFSTSMPGSNCPTTSIPSLGNSEKLQYTIHKCSSFSANYVPENILVDKPNDQASRWTSESNWPPQHITLKLEKLSIVESITFGKYEKTHVCNLQKFQILGGLSEGKMVDLLNSGLQNSHEAEEFPLTYMVEGCPVPCLYIKIVPILTYGTSYNFSIWYVKLQGIQEDGAVQHCLRHYNKYREREVARLCLKHFRQHNYPEAFEILQQSTDVVLEDPLLTTLHQKIVCEGDYRSCERILEGTMKDKLFTSFISRQTYQAEWTQVSPSIGDDDTRPGMRGGHQMCIDPDAEMLYLLGGWDGKSDLGDFWSYDINSNRWNCISADSSKEDGPSPRSCFKLCIDTNKKQIYTLGRYMDSNMRKLIPLKSDFYVYDIEANKWTLICDDTASYGGPRLIFDHQMCMDPVNSVIYVFGGRILFSGPSDSLTDERPTEGSFSGLYSYHIPTNTWTLLRPDIEATANGQQSLKARIGHSMLFHPGNRKLYIFGGQRGKECLSDFFSYDLDTGEVEIILDGFKKDDPGAPCLGSTQRATIDPELNEIHVLSGMSKDKDRKEGIKNSFWVYYIEQKRWSCVYKNESCDQVYWKKQQHYEPCPRYAHQLVYDHINKKHYLFGGNPGKSAMSKPRLDDFWLLTLRRPTNEQLLRRCLYLLRKTKFLEMAASSPLDALKFLQTEMTQVVDHSNQQEESEFQQLTCNLFKAPGSVVPAHLLNVRASEDNPHFAIRTELFDTLVNFFPDHMTQPKKNLLDYLL